MCLDQCNSLVRGPSRSGPCRERRRVGCLFRALAAIFIIIGCNSNEYSPVAKSSETNVVATGGKPARVTRPPSGAGATVGGADGTIAEAGADALASGGVASTGSDPAPVGGSAPNTDTVSAGGTVASGTQATAGSISVAGGSSAPNVAIKGRMFASTGSIAAGGINAGTAGSGNILTLRQAAATTNLWFGAALGANLLKETNYSALAAREFDYLTPENELKWDATEATPNGFNFAGGDALVAFAQANQMRVKGHTLVWHSQLPAWVKSLGTTDEVRLAMSRHIQTVVGHFKGKIAAWDVVNEAIDDGNGNALRDSIFRQKLGSKFIDEAFRAARSADPDALLFYNDYGIDGLSNKSNAAYALVKQLLNAGVPIDGVGLQMHIRGTGSPAVADVVANMRRIAALGLWVNISEMDVNLCAVAGDQAQKFAVEKQRYREIVAACVAEPMCHGVTLWGMTDKYSWLNAQSPCVNIGETGKPWGLPWDETYAKKPAWSGILDGLLGR